MRLSGKVYHTTPEIEQSVFFVGQQIAPVPFSICGAAFVIFGRVSWGSRESLLERNDML